MSARPGLLILALFALLAATACSSDDGGDGDGGASISVLASNAILADWVENVADGRAAVDTIVPPGADLHTFQLAPSGIRAIASADLIILTGAGLESTFEGPVRENTEGPVVELAESLNLETHAHSGEDDGHDHGAFDPHIWMDPELAIASIERIADALGSVDPGGAATYTANAEAYIGELQAMDEAIAADLAALSPEQKLLVTFHDAYGYFAEHYGLTILGFIVESASEEPGAARVANLIEEVRASGAVAIYREPQFNASIVDQIASEANIEVRLLPSDTFADEYPDYIALMKAIARAITGQ